ncbi:LysE family translocator [Psychromonas hadalis]|uniref:LysE family translocator n=1 Tax=Psychromonas hadalis TaxID=211669 RepID=UPI0003B4F84F|nr:LysE family translocator [Psychromonas hadalis]
MDINTLLLFTTVSLSINLIPGPDVIYIVTSTVKGNMKRGIKASFGLGIGYLIHTVSAVFGLSALIASSAFVFTLIKYLGAAYLLYLGLSALFNCYKNSSEMISTKTTKLPVNVFRQGVIISVFNPKVAFFFIAFLPQFIDPSSSTITQDLLMLGLLFSLLATICNLLYAVLGTMLFRSPQAQKYSRVLEGVSGTLLVALGAKIALTSAR